MVAAAASFDGVNLCFTMEVGRGEKEEDGRA